MCTDLIDWGHSKKRKKKKKEVQRLTPTLDTFDTALSEDITLTPLCPSILDLSEVTAWINLCPTAVVNHNTPKYAASSYTAFLWISCWIWLCVRAARLKIASAQRDRVHVWCGICLACSVWVLSVFCEYARALPPPLYVCLLRVCACVTWRQPNVQWHSPSQQPRARESGGFCPAWPKDNTGLSAYRNWQQHEEEERGKRGRHERGRWEREKISF